MDVFERPVTAESRLICEQAHVQKFLCSQFQICQAQVSKVVRVVQTAQGLVAVAVLKNSSTNKLQQLTTTDTSAAQQQPLLLQVFWHLHLVQQTLLTLQFLLLQAWLSIQHLLQPQHHNDLNPWYLQLHNRLVCLQS